LVRFLVQVAALAVGIVGAAAVPVPASAAATAARPAVAVSGQVLDARVLSTPRGASVVIPNGLRPIAGAKVSVAFPSGITVNAVTNRAGTFTVARPAGTASKAAAVVSVIASGFGTWRESGVPVALAHGNHPVLTVLLRGSVQSHVYPRNLTITGRPGLGFGGGSGEPARAPSASARPKSAQGSADSAGGCTGFFSNTQPPATIQVYNVTTGTIQTYAFEYYVENVLPNEWYASWPASSLEAGAMAVKTYGWYWVNNWRGGVLNGTCYDVEGGTYPDGAGCDVNYQCFVPGTATSSTDDAVENTWPVVAQQSGAVFDATYNSGSSSDTCDEDDGSLASGAEMSQWGTVACADDGDGWQQIFTTYYFPDVTFLNVVPPLDVVFQANVTDDLYHFDPASGSSNNINLGMAPGTSPAIAAIPGGGYEVAFQANSNLLYTYDSVDNSNTDTGLGMAPDTSPSITAMPGGGFEVAFQAAKTGDLYTYNTASEGSTNINLGMAPDTSPSITTAPGGGYEVAFQANTNLLYTYTSADNGNTDTGLGMALDTSPAIASNGSGLDVVFQAAGTGDLYTYDPETEGSANINLGMAPGTSPAITVSPSGGYEVAFQANTTHLYTYDPQDNGNVNTNLGMAADTSPSIAPAPAGGFEVAFQAAVTGDLYIYNTATEGSANTNLGMAADTSPAIS
jgi:hypothetical protein